MSQAMAINPVVLKWARETAGLSIQEVVEKLKRKNITVKTIAAWETGEISPNYVQLENLAYDIYKRPLALFFFPEPPVEDSPKQAFRTLPDIEINRLSSKMRLLLRQAKAMQINLDELNGGVNPSEHQIVRDFHFSLDTSEVELAEIVRDFLGVNLREQIQWNSAEVAFKKWRTALEKCGISIFKDAFKEEFISGFCLHDKRFPLIYVNNSQQPTRQIFTLFHELAHLLSGTGGIDMPDESLIRTLSGRDKQIEVLCNRFAAAFLVPEVDFDRRIAQMYINEDQIENLSERYKVSREVILRRLLDKELVSQQYYEKKVEEWHSESKGRSGDHGNYYLTKRTYLGERYLELAFSRLYQNKITTDQLADYLGVKAKNIAGMEALLYSKGVSA
jgi:Zn-dependent peptidase ImmA (M78 family)